MDVKIIVGGKSKCSIGIPYQGKIPIYLLEDFYFCIPIHGQFIDINNNLIVAKIDISRGPK